MIHLAQGGDQRQGLLNTAMNFRGALKDGNSYKRESQKVKALIKKKKE
jgi:hypothetical protein